MTNQTLWALSHAGHRAPPGRAGCGANAVGSRARLSREQGRRTAPSARSFRRYPTSSKPCGSPTADSAQQHAFAPKHLGDSGAADPSSPVWLHTDSGSGSYSLYCVLLPEHPLARQQTVSLGKLSNCPYQNFCLAHCD